MLGLLLFSLALTPTSVDIGEFGVPIRKPAIVKPMEINTNLFTKRPQEKILRNLVKVALPFAAEEEGFSLREKQEMKAGDKFKAVIMNTKTQEIFAESNVLTVEE
ncbi:hypothetical protein K9M41_02940 [Candidatus Gracilibacteria bacterium]|nr:hypothetical protein [Candidatus Gracilibacteria bacterium]